MFELVGLNNKTYRLEVVAYAQNPAEVQKIREQEVTNYLYIIVKKLRTGR